MYSSKVGISGDVIHLSFSLIMSFLPSSIAFMIPTSADILGDSDN